MAKYNSAIEVTFNDNDGGCSWRARPESAKYIAQHIRCFGLWKARWIFLKRFWMSLRWLEEFSGIHQEGGYVPWKFKTEIPE